MKKLADFSLFQAVANNQYLQMSGDLRKQQLEEDRIAQQELDDIFLNNPWNYEGHIPDPLNRKVYGHGTDRNYPLEEVVDKAAEFHNKNKYTVQNIRMDPHDLYTGSFDTLFYGKTIPELVRYIQEHCKQIKLTRSEILKETDDPNFFVGRSEDNIIDRLGKVAENIKKGSLETIPKFRIIKKHLKPLDEIFGSDISSHNKQKARKWSMQFVRKLLKLGFSENSIPEIFSSFDLFAHLCDRYGVDMEDVMKGVRIAKEKDKDYAASFDPRNLSFYLRENFINPETIVHELFHAFDERIDTKNSIERSAPFDAVKEDDTIRKVDDQNRIGIFPAGRFKLWHDNTRQDQSGQKYASVRYYDPNVPDRILSEYFMLSVDSKGVKS